MGSISRPTRDEGIMKPFQRRAWIGFRGLGDQQQGFVTGKRRARIGFQGIGVPLIRIYSRSGSRERWETRSYARSWSRGRWETRLYARSACPRRWGTRLYVRSGCPRRWGTRLYARSGSPDVEERAIDARAGSRPVRKSEILGTVTSNGPLPSRLAHSGHGRHLQLRAFPSRHIEISFFNTLTMRVVSILGK